jgi:cation diffusion facilitator family transporter
LLALAGAVRAAQWAGGREEGFIRWSWRSAAWHRGSMLSQAEIDSFVADGFIAVRGAIPADVLRACQDETWSALGVLGVLRDERSTWRAPVVRIPCPDSEAFAAAGTQPVLWEAFDRLIGEGRWWRRRGVGGTIPVRFPSQADPGDAGWHIEGSFDKGGAWWVNYRSRGRGLLALYLYSDADADSAATRVRPGSHRDAARVLPPFGVEGMPFTQAAPMAADPAGYLHPACSCDGLVVVDVLQCDISGMLLAMSEHAGHGRERHPSSGHHVHDHEDHGHGHNHDHVHRAGLIDRIGHVLRPHSHEAADKVDAAMEASADGLRTLWISLAVLAATAIVQAVVVAFSGSVALLGDTLHNAADALTAIPLAIAFIAGRRPATRRYTYGYGRAEDLAGVVVVVIMALSSVAAAWEAVSRLASPRPVTNLLAVAIAAVTGFAGNELVAGYRIRTGRRIGSAALVADGLHARADGFTSLAVLLGVGGVALGWNWADPVVGLVITVAILAVLRQAAREVYRRLMDAVDPGLVDEAEHTLRAVPGVLDVGEVRLRWTGHRLRAECEILVAGDATAVQAHQAAVAAEHELLHALPRLSAALVHPDPEPRPGAEDHHALLASHRQAF